MLNEAGALMNGQKEARLDGLSKGKFDLSESRSTIPDYSPTSFVSLFTIDLFSPDRSIVAAACDHRLFGQ